MKRWSFDQCCWEFVTCFPLNLVYLLTLCLPQHVMSVAIPRHLDQIWIIKRMNWSRLGWTIGWTVISLAPHQTIRRNQGCDIFQRLNQMSEIQPQQIRNTQPLLVDNVIPPVTLTDFSLVFTGSWCCLFIVFIQFFVRRLCWFMDVVFPAAVGHDVTHYSSLFLLPPQGAEGSKWIILG